ncbi:4'-phosphopantetheinyl transferase family protein [Streptomyces celluloflavus]|uniref:4'-phosphopantetheinyl transferase family protein n=1 Tax=Streptomyces celluloflavus TaxID=58344 RepID=UPI003690D72F
MAGRDGVRLLWRRLLTRILVGEYAGVPARDVDLRHDNRGRPWAAHHGRRLELGFSPSRSRDWIACAVGPLPLGLDIEERPTVRRPVPPAMAKGVLHPAERTPGPVGRAELLRVWTLKEALAKATGHGIGHGGLSAMHTDLRAAGSVLVDAGAWADAGDWQLRPLDLGVPVYAALAVRATGRGTRAPAVHVSTRSLLPHCPGCRGTPGGR